MIRRIAVLATALTAIAAMALPACGGDGDSDKQPASARTVERTKVEVVDGNGKGLDAAAVFRHVSDGVVTVTSLFGDTNAADILRGGGEGGQGTGFVLDEHGLIATNAHVVTSGSGDKIKNAKEVYVQFADGNQVPAKIVGVDPNSDVGLIRADVGGLDLAVLELGKSSSVQVGEPVAAIGSPFGEEQSLSVGVVSATNRTIDALTDFQIGDAIQTDAAINRGNSGGPLLNSRGQVIGVNSQIRSSGGGNEGVGFAVPVDTVRRSLAQLREGGKARYGYIGVSSQSLYPQLARHLDLPVKHGALVASVVADGPAAKAGIKGGGKETRFQASLVRPGGDLITKVNGQPVSREHDLSELISGRRPGDKITLEVYRGHDRRTVVVKMGERPTRVAD
jgi:2-alkenal reductase